MVQVTGPCTALSASIVNRFNTTSAAGKVGTSHGVLQVQWFVNFPHLYTCQMVDENSVVTFNCGTGQIANVNQAFYGTPTGNCNSGFQAGSCDLQCCVKDAVSKKCNGQASCTFTASNDFFGKDPCVGTPKKFFGSVQCSGSNPDVPSYNIHVTVPIGTVATIVIPVVPSLNQTIENLVVYEANGGAPAAMWQNHQYIPGIPGIVNAQENSMQNAVLVTALSGHYMFSSNYS